MRKMSKEIAQAFIFNKKKKIGNSNTRPIGVLTDNSKSGLYLHDNKIAWWENFHPDYLSDKFMPNERKDNNNIHLCFSMCGWGTPTTRERLNTLFALLFKNDFVRLSQKNYEQFLHVNGADFKIDDDAIFTLRKVNNCPVFLDY